MKRQRFTFTGTIYAPEPLPLKGNLFIDNPPSFLGGMIYMGNPRDTIQGLILNTDDYNFPNKDISDLLIFEHFNESNENQHFVLKKPGRGWEGRFAGIWNPNGIGQGVSDFRRYQNELHYVFRDLASETKYWVELDLRREHKR